VPANMSRREGMKAMDTQSNKKQRVESVEGKEADKPAINPYTGIPAEEELAYEKGGS
jgi:hypothetical protein